MVTDQLTQRNKEEHEMILRQVSLDMAIRAYPGLLVEEMMKAADLFYKFLSGK